MDLVLTYDCPPMLGGAHTWLYEVYRRWPTSVRLLTVEYSTDAAASAAERRFDELDHGALTISRRARRIGEISVLNTGFIATMRQHLGEIGRLANSKDVTLHSLRAFPEGFTSLLYKATRGRRVRLITYAHGEEILVAKQSKQLSAMARNAYRYSHLVIANSENTRAMVLDWVPTANVVCIHPGVDCGSFVKQPTAITDFRDRLGWTQDTLILATVARMEPRKNQAMVIKAVAALSREGYRIGYVCAGDGEERQALIDLAQDLGVTDLVRFPGVLTDEEKRLLFASCDVHVMPSIQCGAMIEGFGIVFIEAAAAGKPSSAGNIGGQPEAVRNGETGFVVDGTDLDQLCDAVRKLAVPAVRQRMEQACRTWAAAHDWNSVAARTHAEVGRAAGTPERGPPASI
jgi:phosphatidylinositol alpha-1,6-mannosyltransferase